MENNNEFQLIKDDNRTEFINFVCNNKVKLIINHYIHCIGHLSFNCLDWIHIKMRDSRLCKYIIFNSKNDNDCIELLKWYAQKKLLKYPKHLKYVIFGDRLSVFRFMINSGWKYKNDLMNYILKYNAANILTCLHKIKCVNIYSHNNVYYACQRGNFQFYKYYIDLTQTHIRTDLDYASCAYRGHLQFFKDLENERLRGIIYPIPNCTVPFFAAAGGHLELLKFSIEKNYHKNALHFKKVNPDIRDIFTSIFGNNRNISCQFLIDYLYNDKFIPLHKMMDIAELSNLSCWEFLNNYINSIES